MSSNAVTTTPSFRVTLFAIAAGFALLAGLIAVPFANAHTPANSAASESVASQR
jgi:hypothetical protein